MINKAIIPAAGLGSRFYPITKCIPKEMLPIVNKPVIHYVLQEAIDSGIENIAIITRTGKGVIEDYIDVMEYDANICYMRQKRARGLGDAILAGESFIGDDDFAVLLGDDIIVYNDPPLLGLYKVFKKYKSPVVSLEEVPKDRAKHYGVIEGSEITESIYKIDKMMEKPIDAKSNLGVVGRYILTEDIFYKIRSLDTYPDKELELTDAISLYDSIYGVKIDGKRFDCGNPEAYMESLVRLKLEGFSI